MPPHAPSPETPALPRWPIVVLGIVALAVAMGIGRFAFTPLLPLMLRDGTIDPASGAEWAAANYAGYLVGALSASRFSANPRRGLRFGLSGVVASTLTIGILPGATIPLLGLVLRFVAGVASAWTLVCVSSWCLTELARRGAARLGAWVYTGVGLGIAGAGIFAWLGGRLPAAWLWIGMGLLALAGMAYVMLRLRVEPDTSPARPAASRAPGKAQATPTQLNRSWPLILCYGAFGYGYIVPATFLPAMARQQVSDPLVFGLTWPLFGLAAALSVAGAARYLGHWPRRRVWALAQAVMAVGTALPLATQTLAALAASAVFVGGTFMVATMAGLQLAREQAPANPTPLLARMTVAFAAGQIAGPLLVRLIGAVGPAGHDPLIGANASATLLLAVTALWLARGERA